MNQYKVYRSFYDGKTILQPGMIVNCREIYARCINFLKPMTLRLIADFGKEAKK